MKPAFLLSSLPRIDAVLTIVMSVAVVARVAHAWGRAPPRPCVLWASGHGVVDPLDAVVGRAALFRHGKA